MNFNYLIKGQIIHFDLELVLRRISFIIKVYKNLENDVNIANAYELLIEKIKLIKYFPSINIYENISSIIINDIKIEKLENSGEVYKIELCINNNKMEIYCKNIVIKNIPIIKREKIGKIIWK